jgi:uncharacterized protein YegP (UPF0339 family)
MAGKFEIYKDKAGEFRFRLKASNGQVILASLGYRRIAGANTGVESVKKNAPLEERYERKTAKNVQFMFNLKAFNGQVFGTSELYKAEASISQIGHFQSWINTSHIDY